jgi:hypothetical protein
MIICIEKLQKYVYSFVKPDSSHVTTQEILNKFSLKSIFRTLTIICRTLQFLLELDANNGQFTLSPTVFLFASLVQLAKYLSKQKIKKNVLNKFVDKN